SANGRARGTGETEGFVKILRDKKYGEILGAHIVGGHASEIIHELTVARENEYTVEEVELAIHAHPTMSEAVAQAALEHGRVRVNRELDLFHGVFILPRHRQLMDDLGRVPPHDVGAQDLAVLLVAQDLHEPFGLTGSTRPAVGRERKPASNVVDLPLLALILGEPDAGHLRMAVGHTGHVVVPDR